MVVTKVTGGTATIDKPVEQKVKLSDKLKCEAGGGIWDEATRTCNRPGAKDESGTAIIEPPKTLREQQEQDARAKSEGAQLRKVERERIRKLEEAKLDQPLFGGIDVDKAVGDRIADEGAVSDSDAVGDRIADEGFADETIDFNKDGTVSVSRGGITEVLSKVEYDVYKGGAGMLTDKVKKLQSAPSQSQLQSQQLAGQIGQFDQLGVSPTGLDFGEAATSGVVSNIARAATVAAGVALYTGAGTNPVSWVATTAAFVGTLAGGMISNLKSQRSDTTTAQQRVLDEGKQTLQDWSTLASSDPSNRVYYLSQYNNQAARIDQAYRQMKLDTSRDLAKFETALPNLAEFESFYSIGGERDALRADMENSLGGNFPPEAIANRMMELSNRRSAGETNVEGNKKRGFLGL